MKEQIEILIREDAILIGTPFAGEGAGENLARPVTDLGNRLVRHCAPRNPATIQVVFYIAEDILFFKRFSLPLKTADLKEAVGYQLAMNAPFAGEMLHTFSAERGKEGYEITLYAIDEDTILPSLEEVAAAGFQLVGLYPESQRYVTSPAKKRQWALLLPGRFPKVLAYDGTHLEDRYLCHHAPSPEDIIRLSGKETIYTVNPDRESPFHDARELLAEKPLLKEMNLLPQGYRSPDFARYFLIALCILNIIAVIGVGIIKEYQVTTLLDRLDTEITKLKPAITEIEELRVREKQLSASIDSIDSIGENFDIIRFLERLTNELPDDSYLDQIRLDQKSGAIHLQGYTEDLNELTSNLKALDQAKLKSTRRRKNKTYFHVEISRP